MSFWCASVVKFLGAILLAWAMDWVYGRIPNTTLQSSRLFLSGTPGELHTILVYSGGDRCRWPAGALIEQDR